MSGNVRFPVKKMVALGALARGESVVNASEQAGVSERQVYRWLQEPGFQAQLKKVNGELIERIGSQLLNLAEGAVRGLGEVMQEPGGYGANVKRLACVSVLTAIIEWRKATDVENRLSELERLVLNGKK